MPASIFPGWFQELGKLMPITNGLLAVRAAFTGGSFSAVGFNLLREVITGIVYFMAGYAGFIVFEKVAKGTGALERQDRRRGHKFNYLPAVN